MGCQVSSIHSIHIEAKLDPTVKSNDNEQDINSLPIPTTSGLILVLQQTRFRQTFREFIENQWLPSDGDAVVCVAEARSFSINCIDFWVDVLDFKTIHRSSFQRYRAGYIFEKYIIHGAARRVRNASRFLGSPLLSTFTTD